MKPFYFVLAIVLTVVNSVNAERSLPPIKLGAVLPLTGNLAHYGNEIKNGLMLAREHAHDPVELCIEDAPLLGNQILTAFEKLVKVDQIDALAANFSNQGMLLMSPRIDRYHLPAFHTAAVDDQILSASNWIFSSNVRTSDEARAVADHIYITLGLRRAAVLAVETSFGQGYRKAFIERFQTLGGEIVADEMQTTSDLDVRTQALKLRASKPDVVFLATFGPFLGMAVKELRQLHLTAPLLTVYEVEDPSVVASAGSAALEGIRYFVSYPPDREFDRIYRSRFKFPFSSIQLEVSGILRRRSRSQQQIY